MQMGGISALFITHALFAVCIMGCVLVYFPSIPPSPPSVAAATLIIAPGPYPRPEATFAHHTHPSPHPHQAPGCALNSRADEGGFHCIPRGVH